MILYAESSAVLAWLLQEPEGKTTSATLRAAGHVVVSEILFIECDRAFIRAETFEALSLEHAVVVRSRLASAAAGWDKLGLSPTVIERSRQPFPVEPVRALDAIHLSSALHARSKQPELVLLSLDKRVRSNARKLGFEVVPAEA